MVAKKDGKFKEVLAELDRTQKSLKILNFGTSKLDHTMNLGKPSKD